MDELLAGRLTFKVRNSQDNIVNGTVVQYQSSDYYVQADGSLLWQVQPIQHSSNTVVLSPSETITSGFTLVDIIINELAPAIYGAENVVIFRVDSEKNVYPLAFSITEGSSASWWKLDDGQLVTAHNSYPLPEYLAEPIENVLDAYGGSNLYHIISAGERNSVLTVNDITILNNS